MLSNFLFSKPKNVGNAKCRPTIDRVSTNYWPIHRSSIDQLSAKCRWTKSYIGRDTSGTTIDRVSTECRPTIDPLSTAISTECRPTIDRVSTPILTAMSTDISVDITHSKQDPIPVIEFLMFDMALHVAFVRSTWLGSLKWQRQPSIIIKLQLPFLSPQEFCMHLEHTLSYHKLYRNWRTLFTGTTLLLSFICYSKEL